MPTLISHAESLRYRSSFKVVSHLSAQLFQSCGTIHTIKVTLQSDFLFFFFTIDRAHQFWILHFRPKFLLRNLCHLTSERVKFFCFSGKFLSCLYCDNAMCKLTTIWCKTDPKSHHVWTVIARLFFFLQLSAVFRQLNLRWFNHCVLLT